VLPGNVDVITIMMVILGQKSFDLHPMKEVCTLDLKTKVQSSNICRNTKSLLGLPFCFIPEATVTAVSHL